MPTAGDTGWLKPNADQIINVDEPLARPWYGSIREFANDLTDKPLGYAQTSYQADGGWTNTDPLCWNWLVPAGSYPANAKVVGIEVKLWVGSKYINPESISPTPSHGKLHVHHLHFGDADIFDSDFSATSETYDNDASWYSNPTFLGSEISVGSASSLFGLAPGTLVSAFLAQKSKNIYHAYMMLTHEAGTDQELASNIRAYHAQMKVHYEVADTEIDIAATPGAVAGIPTQSLNLVRGMAASVAASTGVSPGLALRGEVTANFASQANIALDITNQVNGAGANIDSTLFPAAVASISAALDPRIDLVDSGDTVDFEAEFGMEDGPGTVIPYPQRVRNLSRSFSAGVSLSPNLILTKDMSVDGSLVWIPASISATLTNDVAAGVTPDVVTGLTAALVAEKVLNVECYYDPGAWSCAAVCGFVIVGADGSTQGMTANPQAVCSIVNPTISSINVAGADFPVVANLMGCITSKYAEDVPCDRVMNLCPKPRVIELNCELRHK